VQQLNTAGRSPRTTKSSVSIVYMEV